MKRFALIAVLLVAGATACSDDDSSDDATTTIGVEATTTTTVAADETTTSTTGAPSDETTTTTSGDEGDGPAIPTDPADYATAFIEAWESGDAATAHVLATDEAFDTLFALESGGPGSWHLTNCEGAAGSSYCTFSAGGDGALAVRVLNEAASQASPQAIIEVRVSG